MRADLIDFLVKISELGRADVVAIKTSGGYRLHKLGKGVTPNLLQEHLSGAQPLGLYLMSGEVTRIGAIDLDDHDGSLDPIVMQERARDICANLVEAGCNPYPVRSGGGRGIHIWVMFRNRQHARSVRRLLRVALGSSGLTESTGGVAKSGGEVFPKQDSVPPGGLGSLLAIPFSRQSVPLDPVSFEGVPLASYSPPNFEKLLSSDLPQENTDPSKSLPHVSPVLPGDLQEAEEALRLVPSDDYFTWIRVGIALKNAFGDPAFGAWLAWSKRSTKFTSESNCRHRWQGLKPQGKLGLGTIFHLARENGWNGPSNLVVREMNARFGIFTHGNRTLIILKNGDRRADDDAVTLGVGPFFDRLAPEKIQVAGPNGPTQVSKAKIWFSHDKASHYHRIEFDPAKPPGHNGKVWNLWRGFPFSPVPGGSWRRLQEHIFENICQGDQKTYDWLINWMALGIQNPGALIGTVPVLVGPPGVGKSFIAEHYGALWKPHYVAITHASHVSGRFNAHLIGRRFVFIDEGLFGGSRADAGVIKTRVTEPYVMLEQKGVDPIRMRNCAIYMVASNEESVVPADLGDRRWMLFNAGTKQRENHAYFAAIAAELTAGGYEALMYDLIHRDLTKGPSPRSTIKTEALFRQIIQRQPPYVQYVFRLLDNGRLPQNDIAGPRSTTIKALHADFRQQHPEFHTLNDNALGMRLRELFPGIHTKQNGRYRVPQPGGGPSMERSSQYDFPPLQDARRLFEQKVGAPIPWSGSAADWLGDDPSVM